MPEKKFDLPNDRSIYMFTHIDESVNPLVILFPQWAKGTINKLPKLRQEEIYDQFTHDVSEAFERLLREVK